MNKRYGFTAVVAVGVVAVATWSMAQSPKDAPKDAASAKSPESGTASGALPGAGSSRRPLFGVRSTPAATTSDTTKSGTEARLMSSGSQPALDPSLAPFRGSSSSRSESLPGSSPAAANSIRIDHALVTSLDPIKLPARDAGAIREITVKKGMEVKVDEILGQLDDKESQTKKTIAELERDAARIQAENNAQIEAAEKGELVTRENLKANEEIRKKSPGALSDFEFRRSRFEWERAGAQIAVAKMEKAVAQATQLAKEAQIEGATIEIERRKIVAPIDGFVNEVYKHKGEWCQPGDPVLEIVRMDRLEIEGFVYAADASPAKIVGKPVDVVVQIAGGGTYKASSTISFASPVLEGSGRIRQFRVSTEIDNKRVTGEEGKSSWLIQPGTEAELTIHHNPPPPKPVIAPKTSTSAGSKSGLPGTKVEAFKPALPDAGAKAGEKAESKGEKKSDARSEAKAGVKEDIKSGVKSDAKNDAKSDSKSPVEDASKKNETKSGGDTKDAAKPADSTKPGEKSGKEPAKSSTIKL